MSEEENNKLVEDILLDCLDNIINIERIGDILLKKFNGEWKINNDDFLKKLLLGIDGFIFSG